MSDKYNVHITIENIINVRAESIEDAERKVREMDPYQTMKHSSFVVNEVALDTKKGAIRNRHNPLVLDGPVNDDPTILQAKDCKVLLEYRTDDDGEITPLRVIDVTTLLHLHRWILTGK